MLHIKIFYIPNEEKLIRLIQKSQGQVSFLSGIVLGIAPSSFHLHTHNPSIITYYK